MAISTNQKPTIYRNLYENTGPEPVYCDGLEPFYMLLILLKVYHVVQEFDEGVKVLSTGSQNTLINKEYRIGSHRLCT